MFETLYRDNLIVVPDETRSHELGFNFVEFASKVPEMLKQPLEQVDFEEIRRIWAGIYDVVQRHRLFSYDNMGKIQPIEFAAFHKRAFDMLVSIHEEGRTFRGDSNEIPQYVSRRIEEVKERYHALLRDSELTEEERKSYQLRYVFSVEEALLRSSEGNAHALGLPFKRDTLKMVKALEKGKIDFDRFVANIRPAMEALYAYAGLVSMNLHLQPMAYAGQDYDNSVGDQYAKFVSTVSKAVSDDRRVYFDE